MSQHTNGIWVLDINYPVVNRVDVFVVSGGQLASQGVLGNLVPPAERMIKSRTLSLGLTLAPATDYVMYLRVPNTGAMILPITFSKAPEFLQRALSEQMLQGVLHGLDTHTLLKRADAAMYAGKQAGKGHVGIANPEQALPA